MYYRRILAGCSKLQDSEYINLTSFVSLLILLLSYVSYFWSKKFKIRIPDSSESESQKFRQLFSILMLTSMICNSVTSKTTTFFQTAAVFFQ